MSYEDQLIRESTEGPTYWCSACERDAEDCVCLEEATPEAIVQGIEMAQQGAKQLTCERCGNKTDAGVWLGFVYVGAECLTKADQEYIE